jgi:hypothetical protein
MSESAIERQCRTYATRRGVPSIKLQTGITGDPDRLFLMPGGRCWLVEFKVPEGRLSPRQKYRHAELAQFGHHVTVVYSTHEFTAMLDASLGQ